MADDDEPAPEPADDGVAEPETADAAPAPDEQPGEDDAAATAREPEPEAAAPEAAATTPDAPPEEEGELYDCEKGCGFRGTFEKVEAHEATCTTRPSGILTPRSRRCSFRRENDVRSPTLQK